MNLRQEYIIAVVKVNNKVNTKPELKIFTIPNYTLYSKNVSQHGRGIIIYIHQSIQGVTEMKTETQFEEHIFLSIPLKSPDRLLLGCIYRSESGSEENNDQLVTLMKESTKLNHSHTLLIGDFNYKDIDWNYWTTPKSENSREFKFIQCVRDTYYHQHVLQPTRSRADNVPSTIDL